MLVTSLISRQEYLTSFASLDLKTDPFESSRKRLGVRLIFRVSTPSSLKNESVLRTVPFLDVTAVPLSAMVNQG